MPFEEGWKKTYWLKQKKVKIVVEIISWSTRAWIVSNWMKRCWESFFFLSLILSCKLCLKSHTQDNVMRLVSQAIYLNSKQTRHFPLQIINPQVLCIFPSFSATILCTAGRIILAFSLISVAMAFLTASISSKQVPIMITQSNIEWIVMLFLHSSVPLG